MKIAIASKALVIVTTLIAAQACVGKESIALTGQVTINESFKGEGNCVPSTSRGRGFADLFSGPKITVRDGGGEILAVSSAKAGRPVFWYDKGDYGHPFSVEIHRCIVTLPELKLPDSDFFEVTIGSREPIVYSREELVERDGRLELQLGSHVAPF